MLQDWLVLQVVRYRQRNSQSSKRPPMTELQVKGMSCQHCVKAVTDALAAVEGVSAVESVDLESGIAVVQGSAAVGDLIAAVQRAGYEARAAG